MVKAGKIAEGVISEGELYTLEQAKKRLNLTDSAMRSLRVAGLPVVRFGKRAFVLGKHVIEFFERLENAGQGQSGVSQSETEVCAEMERS